MKKIIPIILALLFIATPSFAIDFTYNKSLSKMVKNGVLTPTNFVGKSSFGYSDRLNKGITFVKNFKLLSGNSLNALFSRGSGLFVFSASRSATNPSTYTDASGTVKTVTTSDAPLFWGGDYGSTGFVAGKGIGMFAAGTNRVTETVDFTVASWVDVNVTAAANQTTSPDGTSNASSLTSTLANGTTIFSYTDAVAGIYTASCYVKRKTGTGTINLKANLVDGYTDITSQVLTTTWTRVQVTSSSAINPVLNFQIVTSGDAIYVWGAQLEKNPYMTSYIPNSGTAGGVTRNAETLKYNILNNRTVAQETIAIQFMPLGGSFANDGIIRYVLDTDTSRRTFIKGSTTAPVQLSENGARITISTTTNLVNISYVVTGAIQQSGNPNKEIYINGSTQGTPENTDMTDTFGTNFEVGSNTSGALQLNGLIQGIHIFNRVLSASEVLVDKNLFPTN